MKPLCCAKRSYVAYLMSENVPDVLVAEHDM